MGKGGGLACIILAVAPFGRGEGFFDLRLIRGEKVFLRIEGIRTVALSAPSLVSVSKGEKFLFVEAKSPGVCHINVHTSSEFIGYRVIVDENSILSKTAEGAQRAIGLPQIMVYGREDKLILEGVVASEGEVKRAQEVATSFWPKVESRLAVRAFNPHLVTNISPPEKESNPLTPPSPSPQPAVGLSIPVNLDRERKISLLVGTGKVITTEGLLKRVAVADETVCQIVVIDAHQVFVIGKKAGTTSLYVWEEPLIAGGEQKVRAYEVEVVERKVNIRSDLEETLKGAGFTNVKVLLAKERKAILLGGVPTEEDRRKVEAIATAFVENVVNLLEVDEPPPLPPPLKVTPEQEKMQQIKEVIGIPGVEVKVIGNSVVLSGEVEKEEQRRRAEEVAGLFGMRVINQLTVKTQGKGKQVQVEARVIELDWRWLRNLGLEWGTTDLFGFTRWWFRPPAVVGVPPAPGVPGVPGVGVGLTAGALSMGERWAGGGFARLSPLFVLIRFLEEEGIGRTLSAPNLTLKDGETGRITVGGEIPLPAPAVGMVGVAVGVEYRPYGITLEVTPHIKDPEMMELTVRAEVSELDWEVAVTIMGTRVPGTRLREAQTSLFLRDGETIVIGGLIGEEGTRGVVKVPLLGDLPVIGGFFRRTEERKIQTVLVFFLTAHILE